LHAVTQAALAKNVDDKQAAMLLVILSALATNEQADVPALQQSVVRLLQQQTAASTVAEDAGRPSAVAAGDRPNGPASPDAQISDEQLQKMLNEQPDSSADALTGPQIPNLIAPGTCGWR
jgi:hypothetical protein